jgi:maltodextrin utilization protein YvdJ
MISERDLTDLCFAGLRSSIRDKLEHHEFVNVNQLLQRVVSAKSRLKESRDTYKSNRHNVMLLMIILIVLMMIIGRFVLLKLNGQQKIRWLLAHLSNRFKRIGVRDEVYF